MTAIDADPGLSDQAGLLVLGAIQGEQELDEALERPAEEGSFIQILPNGRSRSGPSCPPSRWKGFVASDPKPGSL